MPHAPALQETETEALAAPPLPSAGASRPTAEPLRTTSRRILANRMAAWVVSAGGFAIIASILGIFAFILAEVWPLLGEAHVDLVGEIDTPGVAFQGLVTDEHRTHVAGLDADGTVQVVRLPDGAVVSERSLAGSRPLQVTSPPGANLLAGSTTDGRVLVMPIEWEVSFQEDERRVVPRLLDPIDMTVDEAGRPIDTFAVHRMPEGRVTAVAAFPDKTLTMVRYEQTTNAFSGDVTETLQRSGTDTPFRPSTLALDDQQRVVYAGTRHGELMRWSIDDARFGEPVIASAGPSPITALSFLLGDQALVVGQANGDVSVWFPVRQGDGTFRQTRIREFRGLGREIRLISPSSRERSFLTLDAGGQLALYHSTSHRTLWTGQVPSGSGTALVYTPKADGAVLAQPGRLVDFDIDNAHPEITLQTLFGRVWYEGYDEPAYVWQSSGSADSFEAKLSLTPLIVGTLKGTFYSLILAIPLAVLGAMYASQFMHPTYRNVVKPTVEIMAALPSVVLGFLAGLWLAPRLEQAFTALLLMAIVLPPLVVGVGWGWTRIVPRLGSNLLPGSEALVFVGALLAGAWVCTSLSPAVEMWAFDGSFPTWLHAHTGFAYDQRNAIVVGLAMGFAVIPIIFSVSEDAFSSVPLSLVSGSLALGATRWQTVTRVVLPSASPGVFSAIMIGFGRAVGETMIVLMATGNTPIMDWSPFNGFRTLSANIAVEIPEAPQFGTLYRVLFLAALMLFLVTFVVNTAAEVVRHRLRRRYGQL